MKLPAGQPSTSTSDLPSNFLAFPFRTFVTSIVCLAMNVAFWPPGMSHSNL